MEDELNLDDIGGETEEKLKVKNRFEKLSEKVILTSKERDELAKAKQELETEKSNISKERDFYKDFSANVTKYPEASAYQDKILAKVKSGYSTEDAMISVLAKEGKFNQVVKQPIIDPPEGGSAPTSLDGGKTLQDMTPAEKLSALSEADKAGTLVNALRGR